MIAVIHGTCITIMVTVATMEMSNSRIIVTLTMITVMITSMVMTLITVMIISW